MTSNSKRELLDLAKQSVRARLDNLLRSISEIQNAANEETKSVAGDKYETGRAMAHLEIEKLQLQQAELNRSWDLLQQIDPSHAHEVIQLGSVIKSSQGRFFLTASIGEITLNGCRVMCISLASPLGLQMKGKKVNDRVVINSREFIIENIF
jgi:transcription elongation GreA/GreB family factor